MVLLLGCFFTSVFRRGHCYLGCQDARISLLSNFTKGPFYSHRSFGQQFQSGSDSERTLIAVKPDGVQRRLVGQIIQRFEQRGFKLVGLKMLKASEDLLSQHYCALSRKPFYSGLLHYMTSGPVVVMVWEGHNVVQTSRMMVGTTDPAQAQPGSVRGDFSFHISRNVVHASDSLEGAQKEIKLWFQMEELVRWDCCDQNISCEL